jgi:hypothetical protein
MLITFNMSWPNLEKKKLRTKMRSIDLETALLTRRESAKIMMPESRALIMICTKPQRKLTNFPRWPMLRTMSSEELRKLLRMLVLNS